MVAIMGSMCYNNFEIYQIKEQINEKTAFIVHNRTVDSFIACFRNACGGGFHIHGGGLGI